MSHEPPIVPPSNLDLPRQAIAGQHPVHKTPTGEWIHPTLFQRPDQVDQPLDVVTTLYNSARFRSRWKLTEDFLLMCERTPKVRVHLVEIAFHERKEAFVEHGNPRHLTLRTPHELFYKEAATNLGFANVVRHYPEADKFAWVDADCHFVRYDWADQTIQTLQHYPVVQMCSELYDLDIHGNVIDHHDSFGKSHTAGIDMTPKGTEGYYYPGRGRRWLGFVGLAWAWWRVVHDMMGGLLDIAILGSGDSHMAYSLIGRVDWTLKPKYHPRYKAMMKEWQRRAATSQWKERPIIKNLGVVPGAAFHYWHGPKSSRGYVTRREILVKHQFNPDTDLKRDVYGLYQLADGKPQMRRDIQRYFTMRDEDATR